MSVYGGIKRAGTTTPLQYRIFFPKSFHSVTVPHFGKVAASMNFAFVVVACDDQIIKTKFLPTLSEQTQ